MSVIEKYVQRDTLNSTRKWIINFLKTLKEIFVICSKPQIRQGYEAVGFKWMYKPVCSFFWYLHFNRVFRRENKTYMKIPVVFPKTLQFLLLQARTMTRRKCASALWSVLMLAGMLHEGSARPGKLKHCITHVITWASHTPDMKELCIKTETRPQTK